MTQPLVANTDAETSFRTALDTAAHAMGLNIDPHAARRMWTHFLFMIDVNRECNLTRITVPAEAAVKHYADSLTLFACPGIDPAQRSTVLDVGTGAGFPAIPLAILCPAWHIVAIDATGKKTRFVKEAATRLDLPNVEAHHARAAEWRTSHRDRFDRILLRAVTKIAPGIEETFPLVRPGGEIIFYKTAHVSPDETDAGERAARKRGFQVLPPVDVDLPAGEGPLHRRLLRYRRPDPQPAPG